MPTPSGIVTERHDIGEVDAFAAFLQLRQRFGEEEVFLLESFAAGPSRDARASYVGFRPLFKARVSARLVEIEGVDALVGRARTRLQAAGIPVSDQNTLEMPASERLWDVLRAIQEAITESTDSTLDLAHLGFFGYFGYDVVHAVEVLSEIIPRQEGACDAELGVYQGLIEFDIPAGSAVLYLHQAPDMWEPLDSGELHSLLRSKVDVPSPDLPAGQPVTESTISRRSYENGVERALHHIAIGDIYQVQLGHELVIRSDADPLAVYQRLRQRNPSPYMYLAAFRSFTLVGASPELYVCSEQQMLRMRPIAGTVKRCEDSAEDIRAIEQLRRDEKEVAEHIMLVDLCRNDLGRVCAPHTLSVDELLAVERYSHVYHLVSNVTAQRQPGYDIYDVIKATFPAGTMTGAPKIRAMEIIEAVETTRRGPYAGAIGLIGFDGQANLALCIRTAVHTGQDYRLRASAGVVADSRPEREWAETLHKMAALYWAITNEEIPHESIGH